MSTISLSQEGHPLLLLFQMTLCRTLVFSSHFFFNIGWRTCLILVLLFFAPQLHNPHTKINPNHSINSNELALISTNITYKHKIKAFFTMTYLQPSYQRGKMRRGLGTNVEEVEPPMAKEHELPDENGPHHHHAPTKTTTHTTTVHRRRSLPTPLPCTDVDHHPHHTRPPIVSEDGGASKSSLSCDGHVCLTI